MIIAPCHYCWKPVYMDEPQPYCHLVVCDKPSCQEQKQQTAERAAAAIERAMAAHR